MKKINLWTISLILSIFVCPTAAGQDADGQFTIATLNVDGLPQKILVVKVNADGPGNGGTARIGKYLLKKGYDLLMLQEDDGRVVGRRGRGRAHHRLPASAEPPF